MRKFVVSLTAAAAALGFAAPAAAQWFPQPVYAPRYYGYGYAPPAITASMNARVAGIRAQIRDLQLRGFISWSRARSLDRQAYSLQRRIHASAWNGIGPRERYSLDMRIANLERRVQLSAYRVRYLPRYAGYRWY